MIILFFLGLITAASIYLFIKRKKAFYLTLPIFSLLIYFIVEVALVPAPFMDTVKFIFSLQ